jgi:hypothetical protein
MNETLSQKQQRFSRMVQVLMGKAFELGYEITLGDAYRDPRLHGQIGEKMGYGHAKSCHKLRLAIDLNLWKSGVYLQTTEAYTELGLYWESKGGTWGGRFQDGNHFSVEHQGMK